MPEWEMRGGVVVFHGCGLKGEFFLFSCSIDFTLSQCFTNVPIYDIF